MKLFLTDQARHFNAHLDSFQRLPVMAYEKSALKEKYSSIEIPGSVSLNVARELLFSYKIFPAGILIGFGEWQLEDRRMRVGDTIVQQIIFPPYTGLSQKIIAGVRVNKIIDEAECVGFSYETLEGHVEKGVSTFIVEQRDGTTIFSIHTWSTPAHSLMSVFEPIFSRPYQQYCTRKALENVKLGLVTQSH